MHELWISCCDIKSVHELWISGLSNRYNEEARLGINGRDARWHVKAMAFLLVRARPWLVEYACSERERAHVETPDIAVHIRWGDKHFEAERTPMEAYVRAVRDVMDQYNAGVRVMVVTEDHNALKAFRELADKSWRVYSYADHEPKVFPAVKDIDTAGADSFYATASIVGLFFTLEAQHYIGTLTSNWSRLINELRVTRRRYLPDTFCSSISSGNTCSSTFTDLSTGKRVETGRWS